jgi:hypothetical protein
MRRIQHRVTCPACTVVETKIASLGGASGPVLLSANTFGVSRDSRGRLFALTHDRYQVVAFDPQGKQLTTIGRRGQGPGEFQRPLSATRIGRGDTLFAVDNNGQVSVFSPALRFVRRFNLPGSMAAAYPLASGGWIMSGDVRDPASVGFPFHVLDSDGVVIRSFGNRSLAPSSRGRSGAVAGPPRSGARWFVVSFDDRTLWAATEYRLHATAMAGTGTDTIEVVNVPWLANLPRRIADTVISGSTRRVTNYGTSAQLAGVDTTGLIWMSANIARADPKISPSEAIAEGYSHLIEVLDPVRGELLSSRPAKRPLMFLPRSNFAVAGYEDADGIVTFEILRMELRRPN